MQEMQQKKSLEPVSCPRRVVLWIAGSVVATRVLFYLIYCIQFRDSSFSGFLGAINIWDANWYRLIVERGYEASATGTASWAFFPLYPLTVRALVSITGLSIDAAGFLISNVCCIIGSVYGWKYCAASRRDEREADFYTLLMIWGVCGFYETLMYTEAMYLMWLSMCFYYLNRKSYLKMGICGALCSGTRNTGVFFVICILFAVIRDWREEHPEQKAAGRSIAVFFRDELQNARLVLGTMLVPLGMFLYMGYLDRLLGDPLAFVHIQKAFMQDTKPGFVAVFARAFRLYSSQAWFWLYLLLLLMMLGMLLWNKRNDEKWWGVINWFVPLQRGMGCMHRYLHMSVVAELTFSDLCMRFRRRIRVVILVLCFLAECVLMQQWLAGNGWLV